MKSKTKRSMTACLVCLLVLFSYCGIFGFAEAQGTSTNFQGPKGTFEAIQYQGSYSAPVRWGGGYGNSAGSLKSFGTTLKFDADGAWDGKPNIYGEMTSIYLPASTVGQIKSWVPTNWLNQMQYLQNPIANNTWQIGEKYYGMQTWLCRWYIAFSAEWEGDLGWPVANLGEIPPAQSFIYENNYENLELWLKVDLSPTFYYQNAENTYFGIGKIQLSNAVDYSGTTTGDLSNTVEPRGTVSVLPESEASLLYLYDNCWGESGGSTIQYSYQGQALNPDVFRDAVYVKVDFNKFGLYSGNTVPGTMIGMWVKGDVAVICFDVTVFSIGEWSVQDVQEDPDNYGRFVRSDEATDWLSWLLSSETLAWLIPVAIFVAVLLFAPWIIVLLVSLLRGR